MLKRILNRLPVPERVKRIAKAIMVVIAWIVGTVATYFPGFGIDPQVAYSVAFAIAFALVYLVPNLISGLPVDALAKVIIEAAEAESDANADAYAAERQAAREAVEAIEADKASPPRPRPTTGSR